MISLQVAFALMLVLGAVVLDRSVEGALRGRAGFQPGGLVTFTLYPMPDDYPDGRSRDRFLIDVRSHLLAHPEVDVVSGSSALPFSGGSTQIPVGRRRPGWSVDPKTFSVAEWTGFDGALVGESAADGDGSRVVDLNVARPGFFAAMGILLLEGREFERGDSAKGRPVAVVGEDLVAALWRGGDPIGDSLWVVGRWRSVVGVAPRTLLHGLSSGERPQAWIPHAQVLAGRMSVVVGTTLSAEAVKHLAGRAVARVDPRVPIGRVSTVQSMVRAETAEERFMSRIVAIFSIISLMLAGLAVYGLLSGLVNSRRKEIAIRLAMGVSGSRLQMMVAREGLVVATAGVVLGGALYVLLDITVDPLGFVGGPNVGLGLYLGAASVCLLIGGLAGMGPGRRAAKMDPAALLTST